MADKTNKIKPDFIDSTDGEIINSLIDDAKLPLRDIAKKLNISAVTVMNRIKRLEKDEIIINYGPKINYEKLGFEIHVLIDIRISKGKLLELEKKIARHPNIYAVFDTTGDFDACILGRFKTTRSMDAFLKKIQTYDFVERTHTRLILNTIKEQKIRM